VYWYFKQWEQAKVTEVMLAALREQARVQQDTLLSANLEEHRSR
jgi:hypothetical protein